MQAIPAIPCIDGQILTYPYVGSAPPSPKKFEPLIYVNGMGTQPIIHAKTAAHFAELTRHDVIGCYNLVGNDATFAVDQGLSMLRAQVGAARLRMGRVSDAFDTTSRELVSLGSKIARFAPSVGLGLMGAGLMERAVSPDSLLAAMDRILLLTQGCDNAAEVLFDLEQCALDWMTPIVKSGALMAGRVAEFLGPALPPDLHLLYLWGKVIGASGPNRIAARKTFAFALLSDNAASVNLFDLLCTRQSRGGVVHIICHSQGNLIVSNVLNMLCWVYDGAPRAKFHVFGLASPANPDAWPSMPSRLTLRLYYNADDPVTWLSVHDSAWAKLQSNGAITQDFTQGATGFFGPHDIGVYERASRVDNDLRAEFRVSA